MSTHRHRRGAHHHTGRLTLQSGHDLCRRRARIPATRCINGGKRRYFTRFDAEIVLAGVDRDNPRRREQRTYQCPACHGWHLTSLSLADYLEPSPPDRTSAPSGEDITARLRSTAPSFDDIIAGPAPSPADVAARVRKAAPPVPAPPVPQVTSLPRRLGELLRGHLRRLLAHPVLPAVLIHTGRTRIHETRRP